MKLQSVALILLLILLNLTTGCKDETTILPNETGTLVGKVILFGDSTFTALPSAGGTIVSIEGTQLQAITDSNGEWKIGSVPAGIYTISFTHEGCDSVKLINHEFAGAGTDFIYDIGLYQIPIYTIVPESYFFPLKNNTLQQDGYLNIKGYVLGGISFGTNLSSVHLFFSKDSTFKGVDLSTANYNNPIPVISGDKSFVYSSTLRDINVLVSKDSLQMGDTLYALIQANIREIGKPPLRRLYDSRELEFCSWRKLHTVLKMVVQ